MCLKDQRNNANCRGDQRPRTRMKVSNNVSSISRCGQRATFIPLGSVIHFVASRDRTRIEVDIAFETVVHLHENRN